MEAKDAIPNGTKVARAAPVWARDSRRGSIVASYVFTNGEGAGQTVYFIQWDGATDPIPELPKNFYVVPSSALISRDVVMAPLPDDVRLDVPHDYIIVLPSGDFRPIRNADLFVVTLGNGPAKGTQCPGFIVGEERFHTDPLAVILLMLTLEGRVLNLDEPCRDQKFEWLCVYQPSDEEIIHTDAIKVWLAANPGWGFKAAVEIIRKAYQDSRTKKNDPFMGECPPTVN